MKLLLWQPLQDEERCSRIKASPNQHAMVKKQLSFNAVSSYWESETITETVYISKGAVTFEGK